ISIFSDPSQELPSGVSQFPFLFMLPLHSPASFVGKHGQVVHQMTVKLETKKAKDINVVQPYSVNAVVDLNLSPNFREPQLQQRTHSLCCWCCKNGPLSMVVRLNKSGYASGEPIVINAELNNKTKSTISGTKAKLIMEVTYKANGKFKCEERTLTKLSKGPIAKGAEDMWENEALLIPPLPPSPLPGCNIIDVCYKLQFLVSFKGASSDLKMTFPINLGTIPTVDSYPSAPQVPEPSAPPPYNPSEEASGGSHAWALFPGLEQYPQIPPPTYQQALA
ncbi:Arrestin-like N-terminal, partial [Trinorchestia longiramus]